MVELSVRDPENLSLEEVEVRLARPDERAETVVRENHYLEFKRFAGRGWRYVLTWPLAGTCGLANRCVQVPAAGLDPRDPVSPSASQQHPLRAADEAAHVQPLFVRNRPSDDWQAHWGRQLLLAETFAVPFRGHRLQGGRLDSCLRFKAMWSVHRVARRTQTALRPFGATRSARTRKLPEKWERTGAASGKKPGELRALRVAEIVDLRRTQRRKHSAAAAGAAGPCSDTGPTASASASPGRSRLESLPPCLRGPRGRSPLAGISAPGRVDMRRMRSASGAEADSRRKR